VCLHASDEDLKCIVSPAASEIEQRDGRLWMSSD